MSSKVDLIIRLDRTRSLIRKRFFTQSRKRMREKARKKKQTKWNFVG